FFQAEDGIRDRNVTGVQTCALPISKAMRFMQENCEQHRKVLYAKGSEIRSFIENYEGIVINSPTDAVPYILNISFPGVKGEVLVNAFSKFDIYLSTTSACSSKKSSHNETLKAMDMSNSRIEGSIRISITYDITEEQIETFKEAFNKVYIEVKELLKNEL